MVNAYREAGVDIEKGDIFVKKIGQMASQTFGPKVKSNIGGFGALYDQGDRYLVSGTDGVGTKIKIAQSLGIHHSVGIDLVAMCVNDIICSGARPMFFLDYMGLGALNLKVSEELISGVVEGCQQARCALIGGETAEMPDLYAQGEYDLAGFAVGEVKKENLIDGSKINHGDSIIGIASSGFHSNGFSLLRKWIKDDTDLAEKLLTPTKIYVDIIGQLQEKIELKGIAHITGGGLDNIQRMNPNFHYMIDSFPNLNEVAPIFLEIFSRYELSQIERSRTFNMGIGMVIVTSKENEQEAVEIIEENDDKPETVVRMNTSQESN